MANFFVDLKAYLVEGQKTLQTVGITDLFINKNGTIEFELNSVNFWINFYPKPTGRLLITICLCDEFIKYEVDSFDSMKKYVTLFATFGLLKNLYKVNNLNELFKKLNIDLNTLTDNL